MQYSIPKGVQRGIEVDLSDKTYDGVEEEGRLISGLGQLVDGQRGPDNFRSDIYGYGKGERLQDSNNMFPHSLPLIILLYVCEDLCVHVTLSGA